MRVHSILIAAALAFSSLAAPAATPAVEVAFSPDANAEALVLKAIDSAHRDIRLAAYSFTSPAVVRALIDAKRRGVDIAIVVDDKDNANSKGGRAALNLVVDAGIPTRTNARFRIHHDKYILIDGRTVQTGSFNYTLSAARYNSENVMVLWDNPQVYAQYAAHWESRWQQGVDWKLDY